MCSTSEQGQRILNLVSAWLSDCRARHLSPRTLDFYQEKIAPLLAWLETAGCTRPEDITPDVLRAYLQALAARLSPGGVHAHFRTARAFLRWYAREYEPPGWSEPLRKVRAPRVARDLLPPVDLGDVARMLEVCRGAGLTNLRDRAILLALLDTGCRASEFLALNVADLDAASGALQVRRGKGGKARVVFVGRAAMRALRRYLNARGALGADLPAQAGAPLWTREDGERLTYSGLRSVMRRRAAQAGVAAPSLHGFRRAFALAMLRAGADLVSVARLLGHANLATVARYLALDAADLQAVHRTRAPSDHLT